MNRATGVVDAAGQTLTGIGVKSAIDPGEQGVQRRIGRDVFCRYFNIWIFCF